MRLRPTIALLGGLIACNHSDPFSTSGSSPLPPIETLSTSRLTVGSVADGSLNWTPDGKGILHFYNDPFLNQVSKTCIGIAPRNGGTRDWSWCDTRGSHIDSLNLFDGIALSPGGRLIFVEATHRAPNISGNVGGAITTGLWVADTSNVSGTRRLLVSFPKALGDSAISWVSGAIWTSENTLVLIAARYISDGRGRMYPEPIFLVKGTITATGFTIEPIPGTLRASAITQTAAGDILFLRGNWWDIASPLPIGSIRAFLNDSAIYRLPVGGGAVIATPISHRPASIACGGTTCLVSDRNVSCVTGDPVGCMTFSSSRSIICGIACGVLSSRLLAVDPATSQTTLVQTFPSSAQILYPRPHPTAGEIAFQRNGNLFRAIYPFP